MGVSLGRRQVLVGSGALFVSWLFPSSSTQAGSMSISATTPTENGPFQLPPLPYDYAALEPHIDAETMRFHHDKHHAAYVKNLNGAIQNYPQWAGLGLDDLLTKLRFLPSEIRTTVRNNGGGHANHSLFWPSMSPTGGGEPEGDLATAVQQQFGDFVTFQAQFNAAGMKQFGSGWVWLVLNPQSELEILTTANQDSPIMQGYVPLLGNDVWEHAYYLTYRNRRDQYLQAWWEVVNWPIVAQRYRAALTALT